MSSAALVPAVALGMTLGLALAPAAGSDRALDAVGARAELRVGRLELHACEIGGRGAEGAASIPAYCGALAVPEDWSAPAGRHIRLRIALLPADVPGSEHDLVTFLDGGPGGAAIDDFVALAPALEPLRARRSILLVDQRGTGGSNALNCSPPPESTPDGGEAGPRADPGGAATESAWVRRCLAELIPHAAPQFYTTSFAVRDLEAVRQALGAPRLDLVAVSYGTRVAQHYAQRYPASVRSVVLDSPVPNRLALLSDHARNLEQTLRTLFARCSADRACARRFGDPYATLQRLRARLRQHPEQVQLRDPVTYERLERTLTAEDLATLVRFYSYSPLTAALLPLMLQRADEGDYAALLGQKQWLAQDLGDQITGAVELSVLCAEDADLLTERPQDADTLLGNGAIRRARAACALWPRGSRPADFHAPWRSSLPTLLLSGELDPVTPPRYGREILRGLSDARLLIAPAQGHGVLAAGCMPRLLERFIDSARPGDVDDRCLQRLTATPPFLNYNGAAP